MTRPAGEAMALGIKEVLSLEPSAIEERFHLENNEGAALLFSGRICDDLPGGAFLYTNQQTLSLGDCLPALFPYAKSCSGKRAADSL